MNEEALDALRRRVIAVGGAERASALAERHAARAVGFLRVLPRSPARDALERVARFVARRST